jgi:hypothetical protein
MIKTKPTTINYKFKLNNFMAELKRDYAWAVNKVKLSQAIGDVKADPKVEQTEESVKAAYLRRAGLVRDEATEEKDSGSQTKSESKKETKPETKSESKK